MKGSSVEVFKGFADSRVGFDVRVLSSGSGCRDLRMICGKLRKG